MNVDSDDEVEKIRKRMSELRRELVYDVQDVSRSAKAMASPSFYIRKFPWATLAVAAGVGYMLVPKKKKVVHPDMEALAELVRKSQVNINTSKAEESQGAVKALAVMALSWAAKAGMNYLLQQMTTASKPKATRAAPSSPVDEPTDVKR
jgi:hypothetical protein